MIERKKKKATIKDVAGMAHVSIATASRVLSGYFIYYNFNIFLTSLLFIVKIYIPCSSWTILYIFI